MEKLIGRSGEKQLLADILESPTAELVAVLGRRRVGKTFLVRQVYKPNIVFEFSGIHEVSLEEQLLNFSLAIKSASGSTIQPETPANWILAFESLQAFLKPKLKKQKCVIFFDEFPWIHTQKSGFLSAFSHFWNTWASLQNNLVVVICGSAASWMIRNIVNNRGGLHNRITRKIRLMPFNLAEVEEYLHHINVQLDRYQLLQLYMALGGIPQYLKNIRPGESAAQIIDRLCFTKDGFLAKEFRNLYYSLFDHPDHYIAVIRALSRKPTGLTRKQIIESCGLTSGGTATKLLEDLVESGFITPYVPFNKKLKDTIYKLTDEYSLFYLKFMDKTRATGQGTWLKLAETASWKSWSGFAFESICLKHIKQVKNALGIAGILTEESAWRYFPCVGEQGVQIDLLLDRNDRSINVCEIKYAPAEYSIDKAYAAKLVEKLNVFRERTKTRKTLFLTLITTHTVKQNIYYTGLVQNEVRMDALFEK